MQKQYLRPIQMAFISESQITLKLLTKSLSIFILQKDYKSHKSKKIDSDWKCNIQQKKLL